MAPEAQTQASNDLQYIIEQQNQINGSTIDSILDT